MACVFIEIDKIVFETKTNIIVGVIYKPPDTKPDDFFEILQPVINCINKEKKQCYLMGDYNFDLLKVDKHPGTAQYLELMYSHSFVPTICRPTCVTSKTAILIGNIYIIISPHWDVISSVVFYIQTSVDWIGLDLFNDDTCPSGHISRPTQVNVSQSCFNSLNILLKLDYIVQVWGLVEVNCVISDRRIPLLAGIPLCKSRELSRRGYSMSQLCSIHHDIPVTLHTPAAYGQWSVLDHNGDK